jgi:hypothetical protein
MGGIGLILAFVVISIVPVRAGGLLGNVFRALGNATGIKPISDFGNNMDAEHTRLKDHNPDYKRVEEGVTNFANLPFKTACIESFEAIVQPVKANCNRFVSQSALQTQMDATLISNAQTLLIKASSVPAQAFSGVSIRWCQGDFNGSGITPNSEEIILNSDLKNHAWTIAPTLAHEMRHIAQYRRMGTDNFKCDYAQKFVACGGCQDRRHALENEAYDAEDQAIAALNNNGQLSEQVATEMRSSQSFSAPSHAISLTPSGISYVPLTESRRAAIDACTIDHKLPQAKVEDCINELDLLHEDLVQDMKSYPSRNRNDIFAKYGTGSRNDRKKVCDLIAPSLKDLGLRATDTSGCVFRSTSFLMHAAYSLPD